MMALGPEPHLPISHEPKADNAIANSPTQFLIQKNQERKMNLHLHLPSHHAQLPFHQFLSFSQIVLGPQNISYSKIKLTQKLAVKRKKQKRCSVAISASLSPLDLTEENIKTVLVDARTELAQLFDSSVGMTGKAELAELDGPYVKISLSGRFWHERTLVLARLGNYLKQRIPEILEVDIEDEKQLDDSPANF